jgi:hypothetical protein
MAQNNVALAERLHAKEAQMKPTQVNMRDVVARDTELAATAPRSRVMDEQFPTASLSADDPRDRVMAAKLALQPDPTNQPGYTRFGKLEARDEDFEWYQRKAAAVEAANFQAWFAKEFDLMSPADKKRAKELYPEFYAQRMELLRTQVENAFRLSKLKVEGVQNMDDLLTQYMAENGRLDMGPLQNIMHPEQEFNSQDDDSRKDYAQRKFQRGLLSPFRVFGEESVPTDDSIGNERTGYKMRQENVANFGGARADKEMYGLGLKERGFPGWDTRDVQGTQDAQWWQLLRKGPN